MKVPAGGGKGDATVPSSTRMARRAGGLLIVCGVSLIALAAFLLDWMGISPPGFGPRERAGLQVGMIGVMLGTSLLLLRGELADRFSAEVRAVRTAVGTRLPDIACVFGLFCTALVVGTWYVGMAKLMGTGLFYAATINDPPHLAPVHQGLAFGVVVALAYGLCRLGMGRVVSVVCSLGLMSSPFHLYHLVPAFYRVYAQLPFVLATVFLMGWLTGFPLRRGWLLGFAGLGGAVAGIGLIFRADVFVFAVLFGIVMLCFLPGSLHRHIKSRLLALAVFAACCLFFAAPLLRTASDNHWDHWEGGVPAIEGLTVPMDASLGVERPAYDWGYLFLDEMARALPYAHVRALAPDTHYQFSWKEYGGIGVSYLGTIAMNFPADMLTRTYAAILRVLDLPFDYTEPPIGVSQGVLKRLYTIRAAILRPLAGSGLFLAITALLLISASSLRRAIFCLVFVGVSAGYPVLQFWGKHYFWLEFITWWTLGFVLQRCANGLRFALQQFGNSRRRTDAALSYKPVPPPGAIRRLLIMAVALPIIVLTPLCLLRHIQSRHIGSLFAAYGNASLERLPLDEKPLANNSVLITSPGALTNQAPFGEIAGQFLVAEFGGQRCHAQTIWPVFRYSDRQSVDETVPEKGGQLTELKKYVYGRPTFSRTMRLDLAGTAGTPARVAFLAQSLNAAPVVGPFASHLQGVELPRGQVQCLQGLYRVKDPGRFPILVTALLPSASTATPLYQTIAVWEGRRTHTIPANLPSDMVEDVLLQPRAPVTPDDVAFLADIVSVTADGWIVKGYATPPADPYDFPTLDRTRSVVAASSFADLSIGQVETDLLMTKGRALKQGSYLVAQGELYVGGVTFGLLKDGQTAGYVSVTDRGPFSVVIKVPEDGVYALGLANHINGYTSLENRLRITRPGWVESRTPSSPAAMLGRPGAAPERHVREDVGDSKLLQDHVRFAQG